MSTRTPTNTSNAAFNNAADVEVQRLKALPDTNQMLELYGFYKVGLGLDITKESTPGMFEIAKKKKLSKWQEKVDEGLTPEQAQEKYIEYVEKLKTDIGVKE